MAEVYTGTQEKLETRDRRTPFVRHAAISTDRCDVGQVTIDVLSDNVFLDIFDFYIQKARDRQNIEGTESWITLVHVCRHWRSIVFESPVRLDLQLLCTDKTLVREMLDIWPPLPIFIWADDTIPDVDNIVDLLKHKDRICQIVLYKVPNLLLEKISVALMQESFPALTNLRLDSPSPRMNFVVPPGPFSGGSTPLLQHVFLSGISFPGLSNFPSSSANRLTTLIISSIPHSGYISPEAMATFISASTGLEFLCLEFQRPHFLPDFRRLRPPTRSVLPALLEFRFRGVSEYLEDFVARIDAPQLDHLDITFFDENIFDTSQLVQFIYPKASLKAPDQACVQFFDDKVVFKLSSETRGPGGLCVKISGGSNWEFSTMVQFCTSFSRPLFSVESLYIFKNIPMCRDRYDIMSADQEWFDFLRPFTAVKHIHPCDASAIQISYMLAELGRERHTEILPTLQNIFLEDISPSRRIPGGIVGFVYDRKCSGHPIVVSCRPDLLI
jgi:hypothetical protein